MKNILVTGGAGYIGSHTLRVLESEETGTKNGSAKTHNNFRYFRTRQMLFFCRRKHFV